MGEGASQRLHLHFFISKPHCSIKGMGTQSQQPDFMPSQKVHLLQERMKFNKTGGKKKKNNKERLGDARWHEGRAPPSFPHTTAGASPSVPQIRGNPEQQRRHLTLKISLELTLPPRNDIQFHS